MDNMCENAIKLANEADVKIIEKLSNNESFVVEAGAGAGKTYSLIKVVDWLLKEKQESFVENNKKVACITFTNAAVEVINKRLPEKCFIIPSTIHSFLWHSLKLYQKDLVKFTKELFSEYILENTEDYRFVNYTLGVRDIKDNIFYLYHDDVLKLFCKFMEIEKFRKLFTSNYPIILIDEYQDLNNGIYDSLVKYFLLKKEGPQVIFFGDTWQSIYNTGYSQELKDIIDVATKPSNFRSDIKIVEALNKIRPQNVQVSANDYGGQLLVITNNDYPKALRLTKSPNKGDLPVDVFQEREVNIKNYLSDIKKWNFNNTKELMLTHSLISKSSGFDSLFSLLKRDGIYEKKDQIFAFCADTIEPIYDSLINKKYNQLVEVLKNSPFISTKDSKKKWGELFDKLTLARGKKVLDVLSIVYESGLIPMPEEIILNLLERNNEASKLKDKIVRCYEIDYSEVINAYKYVNNKTIYRTEHGVKGEEFENVLLVIGRGWNNYQFDKYLPTPLTVEDEKYKSYVRNRNLFYVSCSRPIKNLALFITYEVNESFYNYLAKVFGASNIIPYSCLIEDN